MESPALFHRCRGEPHFREPNASSGRTRRVGATVCPFAFFARRHTPRCRHQLESAQDWTPAKQAALRDTIRIALHCHTPVH